MAESVVSFVVDKVGDLLIQEALFLAGVSDQVDQMHKKLQGMQCFLKDADKRQDENESVRNWVSEMRELAYDVENVIETFVLEIASRREEGFFKRIKRYATICIELAKIHKVGNDIKAIEGKITSLTTSLTTYGIQLKNEPEGSRSIQQKLRRSYSHLVEERIVGLDNHVEVLVPKLRDEETSVGQIVSICGMGGLGKTTLANKLYHHVNVRNHFQAFAWYCVSQQFQARQVWEGILFKLVTPSKERREEISKMNDDEVAKELYLLQQKMKCLVVLDDIWREDAWELLKPAFPIGKSVGGSKIVMTSRNKALASHADPTAFIYELQTLNEHDSWELFQTKAFPKNINHGGFIMDTEMEKLGMEIVKKCVGLPIAIVVLGGLLATKQSSSEWENIRNNVNIYLRRKQIDQEYPVVHGVLGLSFNELPYYLKPCFLHLGHFPEDYDIPCNTLLKMWVAEGFVSHCQQGEIMEDVAERYLCELVNRSIVQVSRMGSIGRVKTCRLHDLMRDFCLSKANEENYLQIVGATYLNEKLNSNKVRRLVVHPDGAEDFEFRHYMQTPNLRSFLLFMGANFPWVKPLSMQSSKLRSYLPFMGGNDPRVKASFIDFKFLKVLSLEKCSIGKETRRAIGGLIQLRYLAFRMCKIETLPSSIENLRYLQTLIIYNRLRTIVPNVLWKLKQLRHVVLKRCGVEGRKGLKLGNLINLQTLQLANRLRWVDLLDVGELVSSSHLKKLVMSFEQNLDKIPSACLGRLSYLSITSRSTSCEEELKRFLSSCPQLLKLHFNGRIQDKLPECQHFPQNLMKLTLLFCCLEEDPMPILEKLPNLRILRLDVLSFTGRSLVCSSKGFPKLQTLHLYNLTALEEWRVDEEAMPNLSHLHIYGCHELKMIPERITTLLQLKRR